MTISHDGSISLTSSFGKDGDTDETNNRVVIVESTGPSLRIYDLSTRLQVGSNVTLLGTPACVVVCGASAGVLTTSTRLQLVELPNGYISNYTTNVSGAFTSGKGQQGAFDSVNSTILYTSTNSKEMHKFVTNTYTLSKITPAFEANSKASCVVFKGSGRFLVGSDTGRIYEVDSSGNVYKVIDIPMPPAAGIVTSSGGFMRPVVEYISFDNNIILASCSDGTVYQIDYTTHVILKTILAGGGGNSFNGLSISASGECLMWFNQSMPVTSNHVAEFDFTVGNCSISDVCYTDSLNAICAGGINRTNGKAWAYQQSGTDKIRVFTLTPRATRTSDTFTVQDGGVDVQARLIVLDDSGGVGTAKVVLDSFIQSPNVYRLPTGKSLIAFVKFGEGSTAKWQLNRFNT